MQRGGPGAETCGVAVGKARLPVVCHYSAHRLRGPPMVEIEDASESFSTVDGTVHIGPVARLLDELVVEPLVVALKVVMLRVLLHGFSKVALAQWDDLGQTL